MAKKNRGLASVGSILAVLGGAIEVAVGILMLIGDVLGDIVDIFNTANWTGTIGASELIVAIILIVIGVVTILLALGRFGLDYVILGIILIVLGVVGSGIGGLLVIIGGILFLIAGL